VAQPTNFSWIEESRLAAMGEPYGQDELKWLRDQGIELLITLTEEPLRRDWLFETGLLGLHVPMEDMQPPELEQIKTVLSAIRKAHDKNMAVAIHCQAGRGRTGTTLACYFVQTGMTPQDAVRRVRKLRPGSIESVAQEEVVEEFARSRRAESRE
jgi:atypical dual specificity phosphatase